MAAIYLRLDLFLSPGLYNSGVGHWHRTSCSARVQGGTSLCDCASSAQTWMLGIRTRKNCPYREDQTGDSNRGEESPGNIRPCNYANLGLFLPAKPAGPQDFPFRRWKKTPVIFGTFLHEVAWQRWEWLFIPRADLSQHCPVHTRTVMSTCHVLVVDRGVCSVLRKSTFLTWNSNCSIYIKNIH